MTSKHKSYKIWIDADACPKAIKKIVYKVGLRINIPIVLVANDYQYIPTSDLIRLIVVDKGFDAADAHIIDQVETLRYCDHSRYSLSSEGD